LGLKTTATGKGGCGICIVMRNLANRLFRHEQKTAGQLAGISGG